MNSKCDHCQLRDEHRECPGQRNRRVCQRADPQSDLHDPGILEKIVNFAAAAVRHAAAGLPQATAEQAAARLAICESCEHFDGGTCRLCGCGMEVKVSWAEQACPIGRWGTITAPC